MRSTCGKPTSLINTSYLKNSELFLRKTIHIICFFSDQFHVDETQFIMKQWSNDSIFPIFKNTHIQSMLLLLNWRKTFVSYIIRDNEDTFSVTGNIKTVKVNNDSYSHHNDMSWWLKLLNLVFTSEHKDNQNNSYFTVDWPWRGQNHKRKHKNQHFSFLLGLCSSLRCNKWKGKYTHYHVDPPTLPKI